MSGDVPIDQLNDEVRALIFMTHLPENWKDLGRDWFEDDIKRRLLLWASGEKIDAGSGSQHLSHVACDYLAPNWYDKEGVGVLAKEEGRVSTESKD